MSLDSSKVDQKLETSGFKKWAFVVSGALMMTLIGFAACDFFINKLLIAILGRQVLSLIIILALLNSCVIVVFRLWQWAIAGKSVGHVLHRGEEFALVAMCQLMAAAYLVYPFKAGLILLGLFFWATSFYIGSNTFNKVRTKGEFTS